MSWQAGLRQRGVPAALGAALLFGAGTPLAKLLLASADPWLLAGLLYLGSGLGLSLYRLLTRAAAPTIARHELPWLAGAILAGGVAGPVLLMLGLTAMPVSGASLLLNAESVFTVLLARFAFKENIDRRIALGMLAIAVGVAILGWPGQADFAGLWPALAVLGACFAWGLDNNLTRKVALTDATWLAAAKGLVAGPVNLALAFALGAAMPSAPVAGGAMMVGFFAYGVSLALFVLALRHLGAARSGAYFSIAPFFGAALALLMGEPVTPPLVAAAALMGFGIWLHLTEHHAHAHTHGPLAHEHEHAHDAHHQHGHPPGTEVAPGARHSHFHTHADLTHTHAHFPDSHHRHSHDKPSDPPDDARPAGQADV